MRVAILTERARGSGAAEAAWNLAVALQTDGHEVGYFYAESSGPAQDTFPGAREIGRWQEPNRQIRKMKSAAPGTRPWLDAHLRRRAMLAELRTEISDFDIVHLHSASVVTCLRRASCGGGRRSDRTRSLPLELLHNTWGPPGDSPVTNPLAPDSRCSARFPWRCSS